MRNLVLIWRLFSEISIFDHKMEIFVEKDRQHPKEYFHFYFIFPRCENLPQKEALN